MEPKETAKELIRKFRKHTYEPVNTQAKQCALIAVDELESKTLSLLKYFNEDRSEFEAIELDFFQKVRAEIVSYEN